MTSSNDFLRHALATLVYRLRKAVDRAPVGFAAFPEGDSQNAGRILAHIGDLMDWALSIVNGVQKWNNSVAREWDQEVVRVFAAIDALDARISEIGVGSAVPERLFQGPIADALTHTGQLSMMRRLAGSATPGENFYKASIAASTRAQ